MIGELILASMSPRREELMHYLPFDFKVVSKEVDEKIDPALSPEENVMLLANKKALAVAKEYPENIIIGCDTVVVAPDGSILGKPKDEQDAVSILQSLSGKTHQVFTGVSFIYAKKNWVNNFFERTRVTMKELSAQEIDSYIETGEPMDKAGAYGIQGKGALFITKIDGDYYNVVGFPLCRVYAELLKWN